MRFCRTLAPGDVGFPQLLLRARRSLSPNLIHRGQLGRLGPPGSVEAVVSQGRPGGYCRTPETAAARGQGQAPSFGCAAPDPGSVAGRWSSTVRGGSMVQPRSRAGEADTARLCRPRLPALGLGGRFLAQQTCRVEPPVGRVSGRRQPCLL